MFPPLNLRCKYKLLKFHRLFVFSITIKHLHLMLLVLQLLAFKIYVR